MLKAVTARYNNVTRLLGLFLVFFSPVLAYFWIGANGGNTLLIEDGILQSFPFRAFLHGAFVNGFSPQWVPFSACGFSLLAEGQNGICFPAAQIIYRIFSAETGWLVELVLSRFTAFALCVVFLRQLQISRVGSFAGASVYAFCNATFGLENIPALMWCHALLPGIFLSLGRFMERRAFSFVFLTTLLSALFLIGHPVMMIYIGMTVVMFCVFHLANGERGTETGKEIGWRFLALGGSVLAATLIASPQLLPMLEEFRFSARTVAAGTTLDDLQNTVHMDLIWAPLSLFPTPLQWQDWGGMSSTIRFPLYALFLGLIGMLSGSKGGRQNFFIFLFIFSILMALGPHVGLWKLVHSLPVLKYFRYPFRWLFFLPICVSYLSARGVDHLLDHQSGFPSVALRRILNFMVLSGLATAGMIFFSHRHELLQITRNAMETSPLLSALLWLGAIGMLLAAFLSLRKGTTRCGVFVGVTLTVIYLFASNVHNIKHCIAVHDLETIGWKGDIPQNEPQSFRTSSAMNPYDIWTTNTMHLHFPYTPNVTVLNGTLSTGHYFSFFPYWAANVSKWCQDALNGNHTKRIYLDLSSAKWLFLQDGSTGMKAYTNGEALSRVSVSTSVRIFSDENALLAFLESPGFDPRKELAILGKDAKKWEVQTDTKKPVASARPPEARIIVDRPDRIEVEMKSPAPKSAYLVLSDTYYPGWKALVDGVEKEVLRANYAFRGVQLPEGARRVVFFFDPLVPDVVLPLPTLLLAAMGSGTCLRAFLIRRRKSIS